MSRTTQLQELEGRIARLENRLRTTRVIVLALTVALALPLLATAQGRSRRVVEAEAFLLRAGGRVAATLALHDGRPTLALHDADGRLRAALAVEPEGALLNFFTDHGTPRVVVGERDGGAVVVLRDAEGAPRAAMAVRDDDGPSLYLLDAHLDPLFRKP